eukprot:TRINITY_DN5916_c0_g1_i1.p1 TRINITY_DN5916_c0_g1~~TRINITY_DN5916_c0_g1_i1.p1  ORF type:complete len:423 (-),score=91.87 TRINITY_DN5916_c0_g1_i1:6-1217(-)
MVASVREDDDDAEPQELARTMASRHGQLPEKVSRWSADSDEEEEGAPVLLRTSTIATGRHAPDYDGSEVAPAFRIKNTFVHVDEEIGVDIGRSHSTGLLGRTKSDPSGQKLPVPRLPKMHSGVSTVLEEASDSDLTPEEEDCNDPLERYETYDHFANALSPKGAYPPPVAMQPLIGQQLGIAPVTAAPFFIVPAAAVFPQLLPLAPAMAGAKVGPPFGLQHRFHKEVKGFGVASPDLRQFTKGEDYEGRLSVLSAAEVQKGGVASYVMQFSGGELTKADGIGFVFAPRVPCAKNIQKIVSVFINQSGRICMRIFGDVLKAKKHVRALRIGDWVEMAMDLEKQIATFRVWPSDPTALEPDSSAEFHYGKRLAQVNQSSALPMKLDIGHFACVVQNVGVTVTLGS